MIPEILTFGRYRYVPRNLTLTAGKSSKTFKFADGMVVYLNIIHNYITFKLPVIQLGMEMEMEQIIAIYEDVDKARISIDIVEEQYDGNGITTSTSSYLRKTFSIVPMRAKSVYITSNDYKSEERINDMRKDLQYFETYLVDLEAAEWFSKEWNVIWESASLPAALKEILNRRGISVPKLVTPPVKSDLISDLTVPIGDLVANIRHVNSKYGLYDNVPITYYDYKYFYCLSKTDPNIVFDIPPDFGTVTFLLRGPTETDKQVQGSCNDGENEIHWINVNREPVINDDTIMNGFSKMSTIMTVDSAGEVDNSSVSKDSSKMNYAYALTDLTADQIANEIMTGEVVSLSVDNASIKFLRPYKDYVFMTDTAYYHDNLQGSTYRLIFWTLNIRRDGSSDKYINETNIVVYNPKGY